MGSIDESPHQKCGQPAGAAAPGYQFRAGLGREYVHGLGSKPGLACAMAGGGVVGSGCAA